MLLGAEMQKNAGAVILTIARIQVKNFAKIEIQLHLKAFT